LNQEIINDTAKLIMHRMIARSLARDPSLVERARASLEAMAPRFPDRPFMREWSEMLRLPVAELRVRLVSRDQDMKRLRLSSPFVTAEGADFEEEALRRRIRRVARRVAARAADSREAGIRPAAI
jgi:hypothetical protein